MDKPPNAYLPMQLEYLTIGAVLILWAGKLYEKTEKEFVDECMRLSNGAMQPKRCRNIYKELMDEAGLGPKFKCPIEYEGCTKFCGSYGCGG